MRIRFFCMLGMLGCLGCSWQQVIPEPIEFDLLYTTDPAGRHTLIRPLDEVGVLDPSGPRSVSVLVENGFKIIPFACVPAVDSLSASMCGIINPYVSIGTGRRRCEKHLHTSVAGPALRKFTQLENLRNKVVLAIVADNVAAWQPAPRETVQVRHVWRRAAGL